MAKRFLKSTETKDELELPAIPCQDACQRLMLHPYITASRTIVNIRGGSATFNVVRPGSRCGWVWLKRGIVTISKFITY